MIRPDIFDVKRKARFLESILSHIPHMVFVKEAKELRFILFNPAGETLLGVKNENLIGKNDYDFFPKEQADFFTQKDREVMRKREAVTIEEEPIQTPSGLKYLKTRKTVLDDENGVPAYLLGISEDITEMKLAEKTIQSQRQALVIQSRLSALGDMASGIAFEVNEPLLTIVRYAQLLKAAVETKDIRFETIMEASSRITASSDRISKVIKTLMGLSHEGIEAITTVDVVSLMRETVNIYKEKFRHQGIELKIRGPKDVILTTCRATEIQQCIINLLQNSFDAVKEIDEKWVQCEVTYNQGCAEISITDSGKGIPMEHWEKLKQPFFTTKGVGKGTGIGLTMTKSLIENQGGEFELDLKSKNTRFVIRLKSTDRTKLVA